MKRTTTSVFESTVDEVTPARPRIRRARPDDIPALERLIELAVLGLQGRDYGIGGRLLRASEEAAQRAGFRRLELISTLTGVPLCTARGWHSHEHLEIPLPDGRVYPAIRMTKTVGEVSDHAYAA